jgi:hypothetical protein
MAVTGLAEWFNTGRRKIYSRLQRINTVEPLKEAVSGYSSGRIHKLLENS